MKTIHALKQPLLASKAPPSSSSMLSWRGAAVSDTNGERGLKLAEELAVETCDLVDGYSAHCRSVGLTPHAGVLVFLRLRLPALRPSEKESGEGRFRDADLFAFCDFAMRGHAARIFEHWDVVDLSSELCAIGTGGCRMLARVLRLPGCKVHTVDISRQRVGPDGAAQLAQHMSSADLFDFSVSEAMRTHRPTRSLSVALIASEYGPPELAPST